MKKETLVIIGEAIGEVIIGAGLGVALSCATPKCNKFEKAVLCAAAPLLAFTIGRSFGKEVFELSNEYLDTNIIVK